MRVPALWYVTVVTNRPHFGHWSWQGSGPKWQRAITCTWFSTARSEKNETRFMTMMYTFFMHCFMISNLIMFTVWTTSPQKTGKLLPVWQSNHWLYKTHNGGRSHLTVSHAHKWNSDCYDIFDVELDFCAERWKCLCPVVVHCCLTECGADRNAWTWQEEKPQNVTIC